MIKKITFAKIRFCFKKSIKQKNISIFDVYEISENSFFIDLENVVLHFDCDNHSPDDSVFIDFNI